MLRSLAIILLAGTALALPEVAAQAQNRTHLYDIESNEAKMEFLRNLRKRGYGAMAKEFTENLIKTAPADQLPLLNLELARTSVALAKEQALGQRAEMLEKARAAFEPFIKANPNSPAGAQARLEMAKLYALQGSMTLNKALASEESEDKDKGAKKAREQYDAANAEFEAAIEVLKKLNLQTEMVQAEFDRALNLLEKANTYINTERAVDNRARAETVFAATKIFDPIAKDTTSANGLLANAYLVKCYQEGQSPDKVNDHYGVVLAATGPNAIPAKRLATYYKILYIRSEPNFAGDRLKTTLEQIGVWLSAFPGAKRSYEGQHLRFEQALIHLQYAAAATKNFSVDDFKKLATKESALFLGNINSADKIALELERENDDFSERGRGLHIEITRLKIKLGLEKSKDGDFENALLVAKLKFQEASNMKDGAQASKVFQQGQTLLRSAIALGEKQNVPPSKLHEAQFLLGSAYYGMNDRRRAAIVFESLARANPPSKKGAEAAKFAIDLYSHFVRDDRETAARYYLHDLGDFILSPAMERQWSGDDVFGFTRYNLALDLLAQEKHKAACEHLAKIPKNFPAFVYSQGQGAMIALQAREAEESPEARKQWTNLAKDFVVRMGPLPASADGSTALMWFTASMEMPKFLYAEAAELLRQDKEKEASARYAEMAKAIDDVAAAFAKDGGKIAAERKDSIDFTIKVLRKYSNLGAADIEYRKGNFTRVLDNDMLGGLVREVFELEQSQKDPKGDIKVQDVRVVGEGLSLVLRSLVQLGKLPQAKQAYDLLMRIKAASGEAQDNANFTRVLIQDLAAQAEDMKEKNDTAKLKEMVGRFTQFGDALAKTLVYDAKKPELRDIKNMIRFYASLDQFDKAAKLIARVPKPAFIDDKVVKKDLTDDQERDLYIYWDFQIERGRLLRLSKNWEESNKALNYVIGHPYARAQTLAKMEQIHIYEDRESYGVATKLWKEFMGDLQRAGIGQNKRLQELYFEAYYYNALCFYKLSQKADVKKTDKSDLYLKLAAQLIVRLQTSKDKLGWDMTGQRFIDYMAKERVLKAAYEVALKAAS